MARLKIAKVLHYPSAIPKGCKFWFQFDKHQSTVLSKSNENEFRRTSANYVYFGENIANFRLRQNIGENFGHLLFKLQQNFAS